jgi:hypothetical protein
MTASQEGAMPKIDNAPGLTWRKTKIGWEARWLARTDLVKRGFGPRVIRLWASEPGSIDPTDFEISYIRDRCNALQSEMLTWGRGGLPNESFDGTIASLVRAYQTDEDSSYKNIRYNTRQFYDSLCKVVIRDLGGKRIGEITARDLLRWHGQYNDRVAMGHSLVGMLRTLATFGATLLGVKDCREMKLLLSDMRFKAPKPRLERLTAQQVVAIRKHAPKSIALAQAFQFELTLRQKDVIGEWVPISEPGMSAIINGNSKWLRGLDWKEIDANWICRHVTSKRQKEIVVDLKLAPMVVEELGSLNRESFPASGPVIINEKKQAPYSAADFRRIWRAIADSAGIPRNIRNMDTRAGAISEATDSGASLEKVRKAATHSDIGMTQRYSRGDEEAIAEVMQMRKTKRDRDDYQ